MKHLFLLTLIFPFFVFSQDEIKGVVFSVENNETLPVAGANVYWLNTTIGAVTNLDGAFKLPYTSKNKKLVISYVGYKTDTLTVVEPIFIKHILKVNSQLNTITLTAKKQATTRSYLQSQNIINVSSKELLKAACCNLSESFETNPSIDVNFADAISGTRQIKMLGLNSPYILITTENIPSIRGASQAFGLSFIPGTWVESLQITKGAGSVVNGFESIAGQINTELVKPVTDHRLFLNVFGNIAGRFEVNTHLNTKVSKKWSSGLYLHGNSHRQRHDVNNDGFLDMPLYHQLNILNRWQYVDTEKGWVSFINVRGLNDDKQAGETGFNIAARDLWQSRIKTNRYDLSAKLGYVNPNIPWQSLGVQTAFSNHKQVSYFGINNYNITHNSLYANVIYNSIISDSRHKIKTGIGYTFDDYDELVNNDIYVRKEYGTGAFFEYNFDNLEKLNLTAGIRIDYNNLLGTFITPRFHARYSLLKKSVLKASFGRGKRAANIFAENQSFFASSRTLNIENNNGTVYGLNPEIAWNYGVSFLQGFKLFNRRGDVTLDYYRTLFKDQVVVDYENPLEINFYNLQGRSFANSFQAEVNYTILPNTDLRLAYKNYDVKTTFTSGELQKPLTPKHRFFVNASYETKKTDLHTKQWRFDATYNWLSKQRFPATINSPINFRRPEFTPTLKTLNFQVTRVFSKQLEWYFGGENILNVRQKNPIISPDNPFGSNFDTTFVYGPIFGSNYYTGLRFNIK